MADNLSTIVNQLKDNAFETFVSRRHNIPQDLVIIGILHIIITETGVAWLLGVLSQLGRLSHLTILTGTGHQLKSKMLQSLDSFLENLFPGVRTVDFLLLMNVY